MAETNFEHYLKKIIAFGKCNFVQNIILKDDCDNNFISCEECGEMMLQWFDKPYEKPKIEIDWEKVTIDTIVYVSDQLNDDGTLKNKKLRLFKEKSKDSFYCFVEGQSFINATDSPSHWKYCELVQSEDIKKYKK